MTIRIVLADDHPLFSQGVAETLRAEMDMSLLAIARSHREAKTLCQQHQPDIILLDLRMPEGTPFETVTFLHKACPTTKVVILSGFDDQAYVHGLIKLGVAGYILKDELPETLLMAIREIMEDHHWFSPPIASQLSKMATIREPPPDGPSQRELQVLSLIAGGMPDQQIASNLGISESTVRYHIGNLFDRFGVNSRIKLALLAVKNEWADL